MLCLFSSPPLRDASWFGPQGRHWTTDLDTGPCEFVPLVVDEEVAALAESGLFTAATLLCRPEDLHPGFGLLARGCAEAFARARLPLELVAETAPVTLLAWLSENAPGLVGAVRTDGEVRPDSASWWRERLRRHLAREPRPADEEAAPEDLGAQLREFVARRGW